MERIIREIGKSTWGRSPIPKSIPIIKHQWVFYNIYFDEFPFDKYGRGSKKITFNVKDALKIHLCDTFLNNNYSLTHNAYEPCDGEEINKDGKRDVKVFIYSNEFEHNKQYYIVGNYE